MFGLTELEQDLEYGFSGVGYRGGGVGDPPWYNTSQFLEYLLHNQLITECKQTAATINFLRYKCLK